LKDKDVATRGTSPITTTKRRSGSRCSTGLCKSLPSSVRRLQPLRLANDDLHGSNMV
jgi:hypothetical protein